MRMPVPEPGSLAQPGEGVREVIRVHRRPDLTGEDKPVILPQRPGRYLRLSLLDPVLPKSRRRLRRRWPGVSAGLSLWEARPAHAGPNRTGHADQSASLGEQAGAAQSGVFLAARLSSSRPPASRALPAVASHAIGFADPRPGVHSPGIGAYRGRREQSRIRPGQCQLHALVVVAKLLWWIHSSLCPATRI